MQGDTASRTARGVAAYRLQYARIETGYGDPAADEALTRDVADGLLRPPGTRMHDYLRARTAFFDRAVVNSLDHGVSQVVVGGAGYDGRAFRYAKRGVRWFEVDHPATQADKLERLARLGLEAGHIRFVPADFATDPLADLLAGAGLDTSRAALFLLEGVAAYLEQAVLERTLAAFREVTVAGSRLAISVSLTWTRPQERDAFEGRVAAAGEPILSRLPVEAAGELLGRAGWEPREEGRDRLRYAGLLMARAARVARHPERPAAPRTAPFARTSRTVRAGLAACQTLWHRVLS
jgi:methyltransferase (TIGR00027 family)